MKLVFPPPEGLSGARLAEAAATEFGQVADLVRRALATVARPEGASEGSMYWLDMRALFPDRVVTYEGGRYYSRSYSIGADNAVTFGERVEVNVDFPPVVQRAAEGAPHNPQREVVPADPRGRGLGGEAAFIESRDADGLVWGVRVIRAGASLNGNYYPDATLREAAPLFDGAKVLARSDQEHLQGTAKDVRNIVGWISAPTFVEGSAADTGEIHATLNLTKGAPIREVLTEAWNRGKKDLMGLSVVLYATTAARRAAGRVLREAAKITRVQSVDVVTEPSAGGAFVRLVESVQETDPMRDRLIAKIKSAPKTAAKHGDVSALTDDQLEAVYAEALAELADSERLAESTRQPAPPSAAEVVRLAEARQRARDVVTRSVLPDAAKTRVHALLDGLETFAEADAERLVKAERDYLAPLLEGGRMQLPEFGEGARVTESWAEKAGKLMDGVVTGQYGDGGFVSLREAYIEVTGDRRLTGDVRDCDRAKLRELGAFHESVDTAGFANTLGASMYRALQERYRTQAPQYDVWRFAARVVPLADFRTVDRVIVGGYGDLPIVNQGAAYLALTSPGEAKASYAPAKRGGLEDVTLEAIRNDDIGLVREIPIRMANAARRTLSKFVLDFIRTNPTIYDTVALYHASHNNLFSTAFDAAQFAAHRLAMLKQTEQGSADRVGAAPANLWVPFDLQEAAVNAFKRGTENDPRFVADIAPRIIPVWYWTDTNDWATSADTNDVNFVEVGFLDGREDPEMFVQDTPNNGSLFSNDKITYKLRHIYGGAVRDFRGTTKAVVP